MNEDTIIIKSRTAPSDYAALRTYYLFKRKPGRTKGLAGILLGSFALLVISETEYAIPLLKQLGIIGILVFACIFLWMDHDARRLEKPAKKTVNHIQEVTLTEEGFSVSWKEAGIAETCTWSETRSAVETDTHFFLFIDQYFALVIPKLEMRQYRVREIRTFLETHIELLSELSGWTPPEL